jgi:inner membrane protein
VDPVTHALAGAAAARFVAGRPLGTAALLPGAIGALLPDADAFIRSSADPLLYAEFHRHFTHALAFIPVGGAIAALPWLLHGHHRRRWRGYLLATTAGYATHGLLDAATTYGTRLLWPFSDTRVAWNWISIVDPLFTLLLIAGVALSIGWGSARPAAAALLAGAVYLAVGAVQHARAAEVQAQVAAARGHETARAAVFPAFTTNIIWRSLYEADGRLYADRVRVPWWGPPTWSEGFAVPAARRDVLPPGVPTDGDGRRRRDLARFVEFAGGWIAPDPSDATTIGDARYSSAMDGFEPVWGIRFLPGNADPPVAWVDRSRQRRVSLHLIWREVLGADPTHAPVSP